MKKLVLLPLFLLTTYLLEAQIVNIENERIKGDKAGWAGQLGINFSMTKNESLLIATNTSAHIQYKNERHLWLILGETGFTQIDSEDFSNFAFGHLRHNVKLNEWLRWEAFSQAQFNKIARLDLRTLIGTGPRFKLSKSEKFRFYLGTLVMYEYEDETEGATHRDFRMSDYLSFTIQPGDILKLIGTIYYQPKLEKIADYRISSEVTLAFKITKNLSFTSAYRLFFDSYPGLGEHDTFYAWTNGLKFSF